MNKRKITFILILALACVAGLDLLEASARQKPEPAQSTDKKPASTKSAGGDEPVAITERSNLNSGSAVKPLEADQYGNFRFPVINNKGEIAFLSLFSVPNSARRFAQSVFIRGVDGSWRVLAEGEKASNLPEPVHSFSVPSFNDNGNLTFVASFGDDKSSGQQPTDPNDPLASAPMRKNQGLFLSDGKVIKNLVRLGGEVPNMPSHFSGISNPSTNSKGVTAFIGTYSDPDGRGLFMIEEGKLKLVARSGQKIGPNEDATFSEHYYPTAINDRNEVAFLARIGDKSGIFISRPSGIEMIALVGRPSPIKGANYLGFGNRTPGLNSKGEVVFAGFYDGPDAGRALFVKGAGPTRLVAKSGETIAGTTYNFTDFNSPAINSHGDIVFIGNFGGRTRGIFLKTAKGIQPIAVAEDRIPGGDKDEVFNNFTPPAINDRGEIVFYAQWKTPKTGVDVGIFWRDEKGNLKLLAKRGDKMPK